MAQAVIQDEPAARAVTEVQVATRAGPAEQDAAEAWAVPSAPHESEDARLALDALEGEPALPGVR